MAASGSSPPSSRRAFPGCCGRRTCSPATASSPRTSCRPVPTTYFAPGQRYLGGSLVAPTDTILVIKASGAFGHPSPAGASPVASVLVRFYDVTTRTAIPSVTMFTGDAPDLGVGTDHGLGDRTAAAKRYDLRLVGTPRC